MCQICEVAASGLDAGAPRRFAATSATEPDSRRAVPVNLEAVHGAAAAAMPEGVGVRGRRTLIKGGTILSMDERVGNHGVGDVLIDGSKIVEVAARIDAPDAAVIDATGHIVMPGFIDAHSHQFETALRSFLADGILINDGRPESAHNYYESILQKLSMGYRPQDVYINELFAGIAQIDAGVTAVMDISQIHHSPEHSDAAIEGLRAAGRRAVFGYFEGWGEKAKYPGDAARIRAQHFASSDQSLSMFMGGEIYLPGYEQAWKVGRELSLPIALHVVGTFGMQPTFDELARSGKFGPDCFFIHMTGMSEIGWKAAADAGAHVTLAVPIEMHMRHGTPPIQKALDLGMALSLSTDVECTMTADMFTQMRGVLTLQRMFANELALQGKEFPKLMSVWDALKFATMGEQEVSRSSPRPAR
jgi:cytosine/adenosine deaminase-related metal-dependent hydrolase